MNCGSRDHLRPEDSLDKYLNDRIIKDVMYRFIDWLTYQKTYAYANKTGSRERCTKFDKR